MKKLFVENKIELTKEQENKFSTLYEMLINYNKMFNLTAITEKEQVYIKHFIDSVLGAKFFKGTKVLDVGSGGGFPAIPVKIMRDDLDFTLMEATGKKCDFLNKVIEELGLKNIRVVCGRAEELAKTKEFREQFDTVSARALARLNTLSEYLLPFVKKGGIMLSYKGDATDEVIEAQSAVKILGGGDMEVFEYELYGAKRALISVKKLENTPLKYPRQNSKIKKNPL